jgi:hypothetical protein
MGLCCLDDIPIIEQPEEDIKKNKKGKKAKKNEKNIDFSHVSNLAKEIIKENQYKIDQERLEKWYEKKK